MVLILCVTMLIVGSAMALADAPTTEGNGNGLHLYASASSQEELLQLKLLRIDEMVSAGILTEGEGILFKEVIQERMNSCESMGANRENHERLAIGFGRVLGKGNNRGLGNRFQFNK